MDLMDMQAPGGFPSLENLSQIAAPRMAPMGPSPIHAMFYGQDMARQRDMIQQATILAQLGQKIKEMQAGEYEAGHEGRMSKIRTQSALAQDDENALPDTLETRDQERKNKGSKARSDALQGALKEIENYVNAYAGAETEDQKLAIKQEMADEGVTFGKHKTKLGELSDGDFDVFMKNAREKITNTAKNELAENALHTKETVAKIAAKSRRDLQSDRAQLAIKLKQMGLKAGQDPKTIFEELQRKYARGEQLTDAQMEVLDLNARIKTYGSEVRAAGAKPQVTVKDGKVTTTPPSVPPRPSISNENGKAAESASGGPSFNEANNTATIGGKQYRVTKIARDKKTGAIQAIMDDKGNIIEFK